MSFLRWLLHIAYGLLALVCVAFGIYFAVENPQVIAPVIAGNALYSGSVGVWLISTLLLGVLLGFLASLLPVYSQRRRVRGLNKQLKKLERELHAAHQKVSGD
ncbi:lipopolysaccharide assembly protein LapA domain-containing protein [Microbulbifer sp. 2304DJ12-6]|uniref:lipopolysaccharide assembly protein LapA domain-containing protein n=1 Tax=Microbulbifer sp. 2304DJ12-6 TaxID=3233340 RepID=UPI00263669EF|nr:lipopolysaccharide assembly protein LapA domain-containing protein [uncultured Microbulbifer sp.]